MKLFDRLLGRTAAEPVVVAREPVVSAGRQPLYRQFATYRLFEWLGGVPDPDEVLRRTGKTRADLRALRRDAEVEQALDTRREAVLATPWRLDGATSRAGRFLEDQMRPHMPAIVAACWEAVPYGYSVFEVVYSRVGGRVGIANVFAPAFEWFRPMPDGSVRFFPEDGSAGIDGIPCDPRKVFLTTRGGTYRNPFGEALLSPLYWPVTWRMQGWQLWLDFLETFGEPIVVGRTSNYDGFVEAMQKQGVKRVIGWQPETAGGGDGITTIQAATAGEFERLENALNATIQKAILGQTLTSEVGKVGSFAAAKVHNEVRDDKRRADIRIVTETAQRLVDVLWDLNGFPGASPEFVMQDDVGLEKERADRDAVLAEKLGVRFTPEYITERYDLETGDFEMAEPEPVDDPKAEPDADPGAGGDADEGGGGGEAAATATVVRAGARKRRFTPAQAVVEDGVAAMIARAGDPIDRKAIRGAILGAKDPTDLEERLAVLFDARDPAFAELVARATFAASVVGYVHASEEGGK